jgi:oxaloacetate decarboxylase beta subunit
MLGISFLLAYLGIVKKHEPLLLIPISFGMMIANFPMAGLTAYCAPNIQLGVDEVGRIIMEVCAWPDADGILHGCGGYHREGGVVWHLYQVVKWGVLPPLIFLGLGAITDFSPIIANPKYWLIGGVGGQLGIFTSLGLSYYVSRLIAPLVQSLPFAAGFRAFTIQESASIGIIGSSDGPTAIYTTITLAPHMLSTIAIAAYSYMALVPLIQPPLMRLLTTKKERVIVMPEPKNVTQRQRILFPIIVAAITLLMVPTAGPLIAMMMLGNLIRECGVVERVSRALGGDFLSITTMFIGLLIGVTATADNMVNFRTILIIILGLLAFIGGTIGGILTAKILNVATGGKVNPLIGNSGVSAMPMAARVSQKIAQQYNPNNYVIMHAMGPILASTIGSAVVAGILISLFR